LSWRRWFFDLSDRYARLDATKNPLIGINAVVPWDAFRPLLELVWRKPVDVVLMVKTLVPSALYNLSDDQIEYQLRDRLSFMRFPGLGPWGSCA
jgi:IS5 family transposase